MSPVDSATGMKSIGSTRPRVGWCHRTSASAPTGVAAAHADDGLVVDLELPCLEGPSQIGGRLEAVDGLLVHRRPVHLEPALPVVLGQVHRQVGVAQQVVGPVARRCPQGDADAGPYRDVLGGDADRRLERVGDPSRHLLGGARHPARLQQDGELVTSEAGDGVARAGRGPEPLGDPDEELVTGGMAETVVDHLELVEIEEQHGDLLRGPVGAVEGVTDPVDEQRPVGQPGERVVERLAVQLPLEGPPLGDVAAVEHDGVDVGIVEQVGHDGIHLPPRPVAMGDAAGEAATRRQPARQHLGELGPHRGQVVGVDQLAHVTAEEAVGVMSEHGLHARTLVAHHAVRADQRHQIRGVLDQRTEQALVAGPQTLLGRLGALQGQAHLRAHQPEDGQERLAAVADAADDQLAPYPVVDDDRRDMADSGRLLGASRLGAPQRRVDPRSASPPSGPTSRAPASRPPMERGRRRRRGWGPPGTSS